MRVLSCFLPLAILLPVSAGAGVLSLDGFTHVDLANPSDLIPDGGESFTIEAWINPTSIPAGGGSGGQITFWGNQAGNQANGFRMAGSEAVVHYFWGNDQQVGGLGDMLDDTTGPGGDGWHHLAISYDGDANTATWYKDGAVIGTANQPRNPGVNVANANHRIGSRIDAEYFDGFIDELRIWSVARNDADIMETFDKQVSPASGGLVAYYQFDAENDFSDSTGNGNDGTPAGPGAIVELGLDSPAIPAEDSDGDGLPDSWELGWEPINDLAALDGDAEGPGPGAGSGDFDGDGLTDLAEFEFSVTLDPTKSDSDDDGLDDRAEIEDHATNPLNADSDGDTLTDGDEVNGTGGFVTDPLDSDTDGDFVPDPDDPDPTDPNVPGVVSGAGALCLDGQSFVTFENLDGLIPSGDDPFTIESWINPTSIPTGGGNGGQITFWGTQGPQNTSNGFRLRGVGGVRHYFWGNDHDEDFVETTDITPDDSGPNGDGWHHLAVTYDGAQTVWYHNGTPLGAPRAVSGVNVADQNHRIGSRIDAEFFDGWIDELRIWDVARAPEDIADNFMVSVPSNESGLVAYWDFTGSLADITGNGHDGTPVGNAIISPLINAPVGSAAPLAITDFAFNPTTREAVITWASRPGHVYAVDVSKAETDGDLVGWDELDDGVMATGDTASYEDVVPEGRTKTFYRVRDVTE